MSYNFVSDFWKINLLGKAIFFNTQQTLITVTGQELTLGSDDCLFIHNYGNEENPIKPRPKGYLVASYLRNGREKSEILDLEIPCEFIQDYHVLETDQVLQYIDKIKEDYFQSNKLLVSHNLKMIKSNIVIDKQFKSSDFIGLQSSIEQINKDQENFNSIFSSYSEDTDELINVLRLERRIMQALLMKKGFQNKYFEENFKFGIELQENAKSLSPDNFLRSHIYILDHLVVIEPFMAYKKSKFIFEKITFQATIESFIEQLKDEGKKWLPKCFIGVFSSLYFENKYAYIYSDGKDFGYIIVESESMLSLPKHKQIISKYSLAKISLNAESFLRNYSRLVDSYEGYQISNLAHIAIVLERVSQLDLKLLLKAIKIYKFDAEFDATPGIEHRMAILENGDQHAIVALRRLLHLKNKYGLLEFIEANTGKDKLYSSYASKQLKIHIDGLLVTTQEGIVDGVIKKVPGYGKVLFVIVKGFGKRLELKLPLDFIEKAERILFRSLCLPVISGDRDHYVQPFFKCYQYIAQDATNYEMFYQASLLVDREKEHHENFVNTLKEYMAAEYNFNYSDPKSQKKFNDLLDSLYGIFSFSKLKMFRPNMVHSKIWHDVLEQIRMLVEVHSTELKKVVAICKLKRLEPIALYRMESGEFQLLVESKIQDDRYYDQEWVDAYSVNFDTSELSLLGTITALPDDCVRIYEWREHSINCPSRPVFFKSREVKDKFIKMLNMMPEWFDLIDQDMKLDLTSFRKIFNRIDRCIEYVLVTGNLDQSIAFFKPYRMFLDGNNVMVEGHYWKDFGVMMYLYAPDQNAREDVIQLLMTYYQAIAPESGGIQKTINDVIKAESLSLNPIEFSKCRPVNICEQLANIPLQKRISKDNNFFKIITVPLKMDMLNLEQNQFVYLGDVWAKSE